MTISHIVSLERGMKGDKPDLHHIGPRPLRKRRDKEGGSRARLNQRRFSLTQSLTCPHLLSSIARVIRPHLLSAMTCVEHI